MKPVGFLLLWLVGSIAAVSVAFAGIAIVDDDLVDPPAAQVANLNDSTPTPITITPTASASVPAPSVSAPSAPATSVPAPPATAVPPTPIQPTPVPATPISATPIPATPIPPTPIPPTPIPPTPIPPTPTVAPPAAQVITFNLVGGTTAISFSSTSVEVLWATPNPGFDVDVDPGSSDVRVEFESDEHRSRIDAAWADGPQHVIREQGDS